MSAISNIKSQKTPAIRRLEYVLLIICLCVLSLRATYAESPHIISTNTAQTFTNEAISIMTTSVLIFCASLWLICSTFSKRFIYRFSGIEIGTAIFTIAGLIGIFAASNKRSAITDMVTLIGPMLMAILLVQILDSITKIKLVLMVAIALGAAATYQSFDQFQKSNDTMIESYEEDPASHLAAIGITPDSFEHMLYEHRLYSKDIRGFLTTSNSTGSFLIMSAFSGIALFIAAIRNRKKKWFLYRNHLLRHPRDHRHSRFSSNTK